MTPGVLNLTAAIGTTFGPVKIYAKDSAGDAVDLTGWLAFAHCRSPHRSALAIDLSPLISNESTGEITIEHLAEATAEWPSGDFGWDLILEHPDGSRIGPILTGSFVSTKPFTRPE